MHKLLKFFSLLQLTKEQPLTGYLIAGIKAKDIPSLADHHYTASIMGWLLAHRIKAAGGAVNERRIVLMLLVHDLPELFGGDIAGPLNRKYPDLREYKNKIGERAMWLLASFLDEPANTDLKALWQELEDGKTDEAIIVKIIDQMDHQFFLEHYNYTTKSQPPELDYRPRFIREHIATLTSRIQDSNTRAVLDQYLKEFRERCFNHGYQGMRILMEEATEE